jgi:hypothetical protein
VSHVTDVEGKLAAATRAAAGEVLLVRPDMHVAARASASDAGKLAAAAADMVAVTA